MEKETPRCETCGAVGMDDHNDWCKAGKRVQEEIQTEECPFCDATKIRGEITHHNEEVMSFEPLNPVTEGHRIFVSKRHFPDFREAPGVFAEVCRVVSLVARDREYNVITSKGKNATQSIFHLHVHLIPRREGDGLMLPWTGKDLLSSHDAELRRKIEKFIDENDDGMWAGRETADAVLALLDKKNV